MTRVVDSASFQRLALPFVAALAALAMTACETSLLAPAPPPKVAQLPGAPPIPPEAANPPQMSGRTPVRIALLLPLGANDRDLKQIANSLLDSAELAVFNVGNPDLLLLPKDTGGTAAGADAAAREALAQGAEVILGPLLSDEVSAVAPLARQSHVPVIAFSTDRDVAGNGVYLLSFEPEQEVARVTQYAVSQGRTNFAALIPNSDYGSRVRQAFVSSVQSNGAHLVALQPYERSAASMSEPVKSLADYEKRMNTHGPAGISGASGDSNDLDRSQQYQSQGTAPFDAVLLPEGGTLLRALAPLLPYYDVDPSMVQFLGTGLWDDPILGKEPALDGGWFAAPSPDSRRDFYTRYQQAYAAPPQRLASLSFDAVSLVGSLAKLPKGQRFSEATLTNPNGFTGVDGIFRFLADGEAERGLAVLQVTNGGSKVVSPAPSTFQAPPSQ